MRRTWLYQRELTTITNFQIPQCITQLLARDVMHTPVHAIKFNSFERKRTTLLLVLLRQSEIDDPNMSMAVQQNIALFEVAMDDASLMNLNDRTVKFLSDTCIL